MATWRRTSEREFVADGLANRAFVDHVRLNQSLRYVGRRTKELMKTKLCSIRSESITDSQ